jgi:uncharacterized repeat protein (TIGR02543 family)
MMIFGGADFDPAQLLWSLNFDPNSATGLHVVAGVIGRGIISKTPNLKFYPPGSPLTLVATPLPGDRFVGWSGDTTSTVDTLAITVQRDLNYVATFERDPAAVPQITAVHDVAGDQGGHVQVLWNRSSVDVSALSGLLCCYEVERRSISGGAWANVGSLAASSSPVYGLAVPTPDDSSASGSALFDFRVVADAAGDTTRWISIEVQGYSVDNLAPPAPASVSGVIASGFASLSWAAVSAADFAHYSVYRGLEDLPPTDAAHLIGTTTATTYNDSPGHFAHYRVTALDVHGNESPGTLFVPFNSADVPGRPAPKVVSIGSPFPSPMARSMSMTLGLPRTMTATVDVLDSQGRLLRRLCEGEKPAGWLTLSWDARDANGHATAAGMYFVRVQTPEARSVRRLVLVP